MSQGREDYQGVRREFAKCPPVDSKRPSPKDQILSTINMHRDCPHKALCYLEWKEKMERGGKG